MQLTDRDYDICQHFINGYVRRLSLPIIATLYGR